MSNSMGLVTSEQREQTGEPAAAICISSASFERPAHIRPSGWLEHAPFAFWLIETVRPSVLVELGTHHGFSFLTFCQAVQRAKISTTCYAVDTWKGDEHAGFYGKQVFEELSAVQSTCYPAFSHLIRARFDEALVHFSIESIDILHIDGRHRYEDVAADYISWLPTLSKKGVIIFHDTNVREGDFGVWRFWEEIRGKHPSFEFVHGHGLGVLCPKGIPDRLRVLFDSGEDAVAYLRVAYARLGAAISTQYALEQISSEMALQMEAASRQQLLYIHEANERENSLREELTKAKAESDAMRAVNYQTAQQLGEASRELHALRTSTAWRLTGPLRRVAARYPGVARRGVRLARLAYWTATLRLRQRLRQERSIQARNRLAIRIYSSLKRSKIPTSFEISAAAEPVVSIVIPTYGQNDYTRLCLYSLCVYPPKAPIEIIVVDDAYPGKGATSLQGAIRGPQFSRNDENLGFLKTCNAAARLCKGRHIFFLNNDAEVTAGAIDTLVELLDADPTVGLTGSKLIYPDGTLQEAGGIVWSDASAWNFGRNGDPHRPEFNYRREVDYISGAAIMVRKSTFDELNGFDEIFAPAYYEDTDLAFRIRAHGLRVVYEPRSVVIHHEGKSHGVDISSGGKAYQVRNAATMKTRWLRVLAREHYPNGRSVLRARDRARGRPVILVVDHYVPEPDRDAGSRSTMGVLESLVAAGWDVKFWPENRAYSPEYTPRLEAMGIETLDGRSPETLAGWLSANKDDIDHVMLTRPGTAVTALPIVTAAAPKARLSYYGVDIHFERMRREATLTGNAEIMAEAARMEQLERLLWLQFEVVIYLSEEEADLVRKLEPAVNSVSIVGFAQSRFVDRSQPSEGCTIVFVAGFAHPPNVDAAKYLVQDVMPAVWKELPQARLALVGSKPTPEVEALASANVVVTGWVSNDDLQAWYDRARVCVVPLRFGAGVKGKVVEALCEGVPLVTTPTGAQGIGGLEKVARIATDAPEFIAAVLTLLVDDAAWLQQSAAQVAFGRSHFSAEAMRLSLLKALDNPTAAHTLRSARVHGGSNCHPSAEADDETYNNRIQAQIAQHAHAPIHDSPKIADWANEQFLAPMLGKLFEATSVADIYAIELCKAAERTGCDCIVSLGAGDGAQEIAVLQAAARLGLTPFRIICLELSEILIDRSMAAVEAAGLAGRIDMRSADLNAELALEGGPFAGFMAHHSLHHIEALETLFDGVARYMHPEGVFVTFDMIGRNSHMRWPEVLGPVRDIWRQLPVKLKRDHARGRDDLWFTDWDCSIEGFEGVRAQDILPLLNRRFRFEKFLAWGGLSDVFVDRRFGYNFDPAITADREFISSIVAAEDRLIASGRNYPTQMVAVMRSLSSVTAPGLPLYFDNRSPDRMERVIELNLPVPTLAEIGLTLPYARPEIRKPVRIEVDTTVFFERNNLSGLELLLWGWERPDMDFVWAYGPESALELTVTPDARRLRIATFGYVAPNVESQVLTFAVNGRPAATAVHTPAGERQETDVPLNGAAKDGETVRITITASRPRRPDIDGGDDKRPLSFGLISLTPLAAPTFLSQLGLS